MRRSLFVPVLLAVSLAVTGCSSGGGAGSPSAPSTDPAIVDPQAPVGDGSANDQGSVLPRGAAAALPPLSDVAISFSARTKALDQPTHVTNARDGSGRLFVTELGGRIKVYLGGGKLQAKPYLDIRSRVKSGGESGLLGLAFRSDFSAKPRLWVAYIAKNGSLQVSRFTAKSATSTSVSASTEKKVLNVPHPNNSNHNGGMLAFGPDGYLYIGTGDGGGGGDPDNNAQDKTALLGKILRVDVTRACGTKAYCIPSTNPYAKSSTLRRQIWALGVRNPWRFSFDAKNGDLWIGDVGQDRYEEIDRIPAGAKAWNLGWPCREATRTYDANRCKSGATYRGPAESYSHASGESVTGGYVYRGSRYKSIAAGRYVYADFISGRVWLRASGGATRQVASLDLISSFGVNGNGELYAVTLDGGLYAVKFRKV